MKRDIKGDPDRLKVLIKISLQNSATASFKELARVIRVVKRMLVATQVDGWTEADSL